MLDFFRRWIWGEEENLPPLAPVVVSAELPTADEVKKTLTSSQQKTEEAEGVVTMEATAEETASKEQLENDLTQEYLAASLEPQYALDRTQPEEITQPPQQVENTPQNAKEEPTALLEKHDYVYGETNLETIGYFTASYKRHYPKPKEKRNVVLSHGRVFSFVATSAYGEPNAEDLDLYRAFQKILDEYWKANPEWTEKDPVRFSTRKMILYAKRKESGRERKAVHDWVHRQAFTGIEGSVFLGKDKGYAKGLVGGMFVQAVARGEKLPDGTEAEMNYVQLSHWYVANVRVNHYTTLLDRTLHYDFKRNAIAKVLTPILFHRWYISKAVPTPFAYSSLAQRLGLPLQKHLARVKQQLDPSNRAMSKRGILAQWKYEPSSDGKDWNIIYAPGEAYFAYQKERRARRAQAKQVEETKRQPRLLLLPTDDPYEPTLEGNTLTELAEKAIELERIKKEIRGQFGKKKEIL